MPSSPARGPGLRISEPLLRGRGALQERAVGLWARLPGSCRCSGGINCFPRGSPTWEVVCITGEATPGTSPAPARCPGGCKQPSVTPHREGGTSCLSLGFSKDPSVNHLCEVISVKWAGQGREPAGGAVKRFRCDSGPRSWRASTGTAGRRLWGVPLGTPALPHVGRSARGSCQGKPADAAGAIGRHRKRTLRAPEPQNQRK